ncbi:MAG: hypothetical protein IT204_20115 [Fimbriimonadaceae bacterium]|nr:hypothetical protein [Fimbriimonadaceae bacterium]
MPTAIRPRLRAVLLGTLLIPLNAYFVIQVEVVYASMQATNLSLFYNVIGSLTAVVAINAVVRRLAPRQALTTAEVRVIGVMLTVATALFGVDMLQIFVGLLPHAHQFATPENRWEQLFLMHLPPWLVVHDRAALDDLYRGYSSLAAPGHWAAWSRPLLVWGCFLAGLLAFCAGVAALLRRPWAEHERLTFPIIALPLALTEPGRMLWRDGLFWCGFLLATAINLSRALHTWIPSFPEIRQKWDAAAAFTAPPWNGVGWTPLSFYPFAIGLGYLMPLELSFSCWLFYLLWKVQLVVRAAIGLGPLEGAWIGAQGHGAWIGLGLMALFTTRRELLRTLRAALRGSDDGSEAMSPRTAWLAMGLGLLAMAGIGHRAGFATPAIGGWLAIYAVIVVCIARMRAELGPPSCDLPRGSPDRMMVAFLGPEAFGPRNLSLFYLLDWLTYSYRAHPVGHQIESFQIGQRSGLDLRRLTAILAWSMLVAYVAWCWLALDAVYRFGFNARIRSYLDDAANQNWTELATVLQGKVGANQAYIRQFLSGLAVIVSLVLVRQRFVFFPIHPVGYAVNGNWTLSHLWFSLFLAWLLKSTLVKAGGLRAYRRGLPLCFGLMLGDCLVGGGLCLLSTFWDAPVRGFFP